MEDIVIPESVTVIEDHAFLYCESLNSQVDSDAEDIGRYATDIFVISDDQDNIEDVIDLLKGYSILTKITDRVKSVKAGSRELYYIVGKGSNIMMDPEGNKWGTLMIRCSECLGESGAVIIRITDMHAIEQGNEDLNEHHMATTPDGCDLYYDTDPIHELTGRDSDPNVGYDQFVQAFEEAYPDTGKEFISVYESVKG